MLKYYKTLAELRSKDTLVSEGSFELLDYDSYFFSYMRQKDDKSLIVVMNVQNKEKAVTINIPTTTGKYENILTDKAYDVVGQKLELTLQPLEVMLLESR
jgi:alpha-amylase